MYKTFIAIAVLVAVPVALTANVSAQEVDFYICHRTNANENANNPYNQLFIDPSSIDGQGQNDHSGHSDEPNNGEGVYYPGAESWGDIIPPTEEHPDGYNWTAEGQAIWENGCVYQQQEPVADLEWNVACIVRNDTDYVQVTVMNEGGADGDVTVNGEVITVAADSTVTRVFADGTRVTIVVNNQTVYDQTADCSEEVTPETPQVLGASTTTPSSPVLPNTGNGVTAMLGAITAIVSLSILAGTKIVRRFI